MARSINLSADRLLHSRNYNLSLALERGHVGKDLADLLRIAALVEFHSNSAKEYAYEGYFSLADKFLMDAGRLFGAINTYLNNTLYPDTFKEELLGACVEKIHSHSREINSLAGAKLLQYK